MTTLVWLLGIAMGYVGAIYSWDAVKGIFMSAEARLKALEVKAAAIKASL